MAEPVSEQVALAIVTALAAMDVPTYRYAVAKVWRVLSYNRDLLQEPDPDPAVAPKATIFLRSDEENGDNNDNCSLKETAPFTMLYCLPARASNYRPDDAPTVELPTLQNRICEDVQRALYNCVTPGSGRVSRTMRKNKGKSPIDGWVVVEFELHVTYDWTLTP